MKLQKCILVILTSLNISIFFSYTIILTSDTIVASTVSIQYLYSI